MHARAVNSYRQGAVATLEAKFYDDAGELADPTTVTLRVLSPTTPDATETVLVFGLGADVVRDGVGEFHADVVVDTAGLWFYRWEATGTVQAVDEHSFKVLASAFPPPA